jgi:hypothetical protein
MRKGGAMKGLMVTIDRDDLWRLESENDRRSQEIVALNTQIATLKAGLQVAIDFIAMVRDYPLIKQGDLVRALNEAKKESAFILPDLRNMMV